MTLITAADLGPAYLPTRGEEWSSTQAGKPDAAHEQIYIDAPSFVVGIVASILVAAFTLALLSAIDGVIA